MGGAAVGGGVVVGCGASEEFGAADAGGEEVFEGAREVVVVFLGADEECLVELAEVGGDGTQILWTDCR